MYTYSYNKARGLLVGLLSGRYNSETDYRRVVYTIGQLIDDARGRPGGAVCVLAAEPENPHPNAAWRKRLAELQERAGSRTQRFLFVLVTESQIMRGVMTEIRWLKPPTPPHETVTISTFEEAMRWVEARRGESLFELRGLLLEAARSRSSASLGLV
jgi:hypothetical protein